MSASLRLPLQQATLGDSGLSGGPDYTVTVDCSDLMSDIALRFLAGDTLAELLPDLYYGVQAEVEEFLSVLLETIRLAMEVNMPSRDTIGPSNSPESP